jgi:ribonuclease D
MQTHSPFRLVEDQRKLAQICELLDDTGLVALDTEFVRESTYFPKLCLIQLATDKFVACVDCLAPLDLSPLFGRLLDSNITWIVHSGRQDIEVVWHMAGAKPARVLDTQIAAALLGLPPQIGLREILHSTLGVEIGKAMTRTNWAKRPLGADALDYALDDVRHLPELWRRLSQRLAAMERLEWCFEDCDRALEVPLEPDLAALFQRTKGTGRLRTESIHAALALLDWREALARRADRPRRWVLADETLVALAARRPRNLEELREIDGLPERTIAKNGESILAAIAAAQDPRFTEIPIERSTLRPDAAQLKEIQRQVRACAQRLGIEPEVLAARRDLVATVQGSPPERLRAGWRAAQLQLAQS